MLERFIHAEPLSAAGFAPFGEILDRKDASPVIHTADLRSWAIGYEAEGITELMVIEFDEVALTFHRLERHHKVSQVFLPLRGRQTVMVVAPPSGPQRPRSDTVRAFLVGPHQGILLRRSVWHALNRFPIGGSAVYAFLTTRETQAELHAQRNGGPTPQFTDVHDFMADQTTFRIVLPTDGQTSK